jgi:predicted FMN-binding regulatory protein PaiB
MMTETPSTAQGDQVPEWNIDDLHSYGAGTIVRHHGHTYRAKPYPDSERTRQAECEPGGSSAHPVAWMDAWIRID